MPKVSIVLPTFNEKENIPLIIPKIEKALHGFSFEIIVADDDSPDRTWELAEKIASEKEYVRVIRRFHNKGLSPAVMEGFAAAKGEYLIVMDADMQHDERILPDFIQQFEEGADFVIGSRKLAGGGVSDWSAVRRFISWGATFLAKIILPKNVSDPMSGYFGVSRKFFDEVGSEINPRGFKILLEFISHSAKRKLAEIPYVFKSREYGESKLSGAVMIDYLIGLYDLRLGSYIPLRFVKYGLVGVSGILVNQFGLWLGKNLIQWQNEASLILGIELSIITNYFLNNYWTFKDVRINGIYMNIRGLIFFNIICIAGAFINYSAAIFLSEKLLLSIYLSNLLGIALATFWNFFLNVNVTWKTS